MLQLFTYALLLIATGETLVVICRMKEDSRVFRIVADVIVVFMSAPFVYFIYRGGMDAGLKHVVRVAVRNWTLSDNIVCRDNGKRPNLAHAQS